MLNAFINSIESKFPQFDSSKLLIAISGGLDSVVLTHLCSKAALNITLAHCNFKLRGDESDADERFVLQLAEDLDLEVFIENFNTENYAKENKLSIQMAARELRYNWFDELSEQLEFDYVLTAHHADDNLETFLINLSRGTGLDGLTGIPEINDKIFRPLLPFSRETIEAYAHQEQLTWQEDSSNASTKYLRNKLRHDVIPVLKEINPQLLKNFNNTQSFLKDSKSIIEDRIEDVYNKVFKGINEQNISLNIAEIKKMNNPKAYLFELLKAYNFTEWNDVVSLLDAQPGKQILSRTHRLIKDRTQLLLSELKNNVIHNSNEESILIYGSDGKTQTSFGDLRIDVVDEISEKQQSIIYIDKSKLKFPLKLRKWEEGDYFYPIGMIGKKKLSKYFKDEKLSLLDKEQVWLLCSGNDVVWVVNRRADDRFIATENTKNIIKIEFQ